VIDVLSEYRAYRARLADYQGFAHRAESLLGEALKTMSPKLQHYTVSSRVKEPVSLFRKLHGKVAEGKQQYLDAGLSAVNDRVGVRAIVATSEEAERVVDVACAVFDVEADAVDRKALTNPADALRYLGTHVSARLRDENRSELASDIADMVFEVQIHTLSETAWAVISHPLVYKPYGQRPHEVASKVFRSIALVSLFDSEVDQALKLQRASPDYAAVEMLRIIDPLFDPWRQSRTDDDLSLQILDAVRSTYGEGFDVDAFGDQMRTWVSTNEDKVNALLTQYIDLADTSPLLHQPEILVLIERLSAVKHQLRQAWLGNGLDISLLYDVADIIGDAYTQG
jgi:ppGpp synthetase/RelA/SpoT-type nucleotidyltranferase